MWYRWGEELIDFLRCIQRHSEVRGLTSERGFHHGEWYDPRGLLPPQRQRPHPGYLGPGVSPTYWVCAYANNQHDLSALQVKGARVKGDP